jgi:putative DNA primase/helicase
MDITEHLTGEEKESFAREKKVEQDTKIDELLLEIESLPFENRLNFCRKNMPDIFRAISEIKKAQVCKKIGKLLEVPATVVKKELQPITGHRVEWFDCDGRFVPPPLIEKLLLDYKIEYDRQDLFVYQDGVFLPNGREYVKKIVLDTLGDNYRDMHGNEVIRQIETKLHQNEPILDCNQFIINLKNGVIDIRDKEIKLKKHSTDYLSSIRIPITYNPDAKCPTILKFLSDVLHPDCIEIAKELFGYCLLPNSRMQKAFLLKSGGESGKSVFIDLMSCFLGEKNVSGDSLQDLTENRFRTANLCGKLANICADISNKVIEDTSLFKALVGGDWVSAERKGQDPFKFKNIAKLIFSANELPRTKDNSHGFFRRWVILDFPKQFLIGDPNRDPNLIDKLTTPEELSGLLNLAIAGLKKLLTRGYFEVPDTAAAALLEYNLQNDSAKAYLLECVSESSESKITRKYLYEEYKNYCQESEIHPVSSKKFTPKVREAFPKIGELTSSGERYWTGIKIGIEDENPF